MTEAIQSRLMHLIYSWDTCKSLRGACLCVPPLCSVSPFVLRSPLPRLSVSLRRRLAPFAPISRVLRYPQSPMPHLQQKVIVTWNEPLVGGGTSSRKYYTLVARDSQGRVRREIREFVPADSNDEPPLRTFTILDPVSDTRTVCTKSSMNCATSAFYPRISLGSSDGTLSSSSGNVTRESLGQQTMNDLPVVGTRETVSNAGNNRIALTHTDVWYSPDLQMDLSVVRNTPQLGEVTLQVTNLVRAEPDSSLLSVPSGYAVRGGPNQ